MDARSQNPAGKKFSSTASPEFRKGTRATGYAFVRTAKMDPLAAPMVRTPLAAEEPTPILAAQRSDSRLLAPGFDFVSLFP
jgi:hypothetical protein